MPMIQVFQVTNPVYKQSILGPYDTAYDWNDFDIYLEQVLHPKKNTFSEIIINIYTDV